MTAVNHARGVKLLLKVELTPLSGTFTALCTINAARGITFDAATNDIVIPDCTDPDLIGWISREKVSLSAGVTGAGILNTDDTQTFFDWAISENTLNAQIVVDVSGANGGVTFEGAFHLTNFALTGDKGGKIEASITLASDGAITATANA